MNPIKAACLPIVFCVFSLYAYSQSPGGVSTNLYLWLKPGAGVIQSSGNVSQWTNQATGVTMTTQPSKTANTNMILVNNGINFNPVIRCNGVEALIGQYATTPTQPIFMFAAVTGGSGSTGIANVYSNSPAGAMGLQYDATTGQYHIDGAGTRCSPSPANLNKTILAREYYSSATDETGAYTAINGIANGACATNPVNAPTGGLEVGGRTWDVGGRFFIGDMSELIYYNSNTATAAQINQIESYLALKYGITQGNTSNLINYTASDGSTVFWTGNSTYQNDVFGIGTDNGSALTQTQSNSMNTGAGDGTGQSAKGNLELTTLSALANKQFLLIGDDAGALAEQTTNLPSSAAASKRLTRSWKVANTGTVGAVNLSFDKTGLTLTGGSTAANYRLLINNNGTSNFTTGTQTYLTPASITGNLVNFTGITLSNGVVFTLITQAAANLPVTWVSFTAAPIGGKVVLVWKTDIEDHVDHYEVQHTADGVHYTTVSVVAPAFGAGIKTYESDFDLKGLPSGINYYRIKEVDIDGNYTYSDTRAVRLNEAAALQVTGNPIKAGILELVITASQPGSSVVSIAGTDGKLLLQQPVSLQAGANLIHVNIGHLPSGLYILQAQTGGQISTTKFLK